MYLHTHMHPSTADSIDTILLSTQPVGRFIMKPTLPCHVHASVAFGGEACVACGTSCRHRSLDHDSGDLETVKKDLAANPPLEPFARTHARTWVHEGRESAPHASAPVLAGVRDMTRMLPDLHWSAHDPGNASGIIHTLSLNLLVQMSVGTVIISFGSMSRFTNMLLFTV